MGKWIRADTMRPPVNAAGEHSDLILFVTPRDGVTAGVWDEKCGHWRDDALAITWTFHEIKWWRPLPKPPKPRPDLHKHRCEGMPEGVYLELDSVFVWTLKRETGNNWGLTLVAHCRFCPYCGAELLLFPEKAARQ